MIRGVTRERVQVPQVRLATTLMYHGVTDETGAPDAAADVNYTVSAERFGEQLDLVSRAGLAVSTVSDLAQTREHVSPNSPYRHAVVFTFNDGTASHLDPVLHMLWERNMPGEFFVAPANVGRKGYLSWNELRGMASAGMSIQSQGYSRRCLLDLDDRAAADELLRSRKVIEDRIGQAVTVFAAPGGRVNGFIAALARRVGYKAVCGSRPGQWRPRSGQKIVPRIAIRPATTTAEIAAWISNRPFALVAQSGRYRVQQMARWALGSHVFDNLRQRYLGDH